jgi:hypothetical protein
MRHITRPLVQRNSLWSGPYLPGWKVTWPLDTARGTVQRTFDTWAEAYAFARSLA